jgi:hypothetical protein
MAGRLCADGVGYVLAPRRWRVRVTRLLHNLGLLTVLAIGHLPDWESSNYLLPFDRISIHYALSTLIPSLAWKRYLVRQWFRLPGAGKLLGYIWPSAGLVVRHPGARPLFEWLFRAGSEHCRPGNALIRTSWRGQNGATLLYRFSDCESLPSAVAKINVNANSLNDQTREASVLAQLSASARSAGAQIPEILLLEQNGHRSSLIQTVVPGRKADELLRSQPDQLTFILTQLVGWLERWHRSTVVLRPLNIEQQRHALLVPVDLLAPLLERGEEYRTWLKTRFSAASGVPMPFVATHNDLTMANLLLDEDGHLGVVDWETGQVEGWPLVDFFYAITDAVMSASKSTDRVEAFKACFTPGGVYTSLVIQFQNHLMSAIKISSGLAELCLHVCWLHHAVNEHLLSQPGASRPFLRIVQWLAYNYPVFEGERV